jgi:hypothetical protein
MSSQPHLVTTTRRQGRRSGAEIDFSETKTRRPGFWRPGASTRDLTATPERGLALGIDGGLTSAPQRGFNYLMDVGGKSVT